MSLEGFFNRRPFLIPGLIAAVFLFGSLGSWPYGYYQLLRWVVCGISIFAALMAYADEKQWLLWPFALMAILFNPLVPIHLDRSVWAFIDIACGVVFLTTGLIFKSKTTTSSGG